MIPIFSADNIQYFLCERHALQTGGLLVPNHSSHITTLLTFDIGREVANSRQSVEKENNTRVWIFIIFSITSTKYTFRSVTVSSIFNRMNEMEPLVPQHQNGAIEEEGGRDNEPSSITLQDENDDDVNPHDRLWNVVMVRSQQTSLIVAPLLALSALLYVSVWISRLGGLAWEHGHSKLIFNWHPLMMILAFLFMTVATISFRYPTMIAQGRISRTTAKWCHGLCWTVAALCMMIGLIAVFRSHNDPISGFIANLYSFHSWVGLTIVICYMFQLLAGAGVFGIPDRLAISASVKAKLLQIHSFMGPLLYQGICLTILLGIQEKEGFIGCGYQVDEADTKPWKHHGEIPAVCRISHGMGFMVLLTAFMTSFAMHSFDRGVGHRRN